MTPAKVLFPWINQVPAPLPRAHHVLKGETRKVGYLALDDQRQFLGLVHDVSGDSEH
jgi:hypothetical protein